MKEKMIGNYGSNEIHGTSSRSSHSSQKFKRLIPPRGDYRTLFSFQKTEVVYDLTFRLAHKFPEIEKAGLYGSRGKGTFKGAVVRTVVLLLEKGTPKRKVWCYRLDPGRNLGETNQLKDDDLAESLELQKTHADSPKSSSVNVGRSLSGVEKEVDFSVKNPNGREEIAHGIPEAIMAEIARLRRECGSAEEY